MAVNEAPRPILQGLGSSPAKWLWCTLESACEGIFDCPHSTPKLCADGPFIARSQDIRTSVLQLDQAAHVSEDTYLERTCRAEPRHGDLLYSREGTYFGIAAEVPRSIRLCLGQRMVLIRPDRSKVSSRYLYYWLNFPVLANHVNGYRDGSVAERLNLPTIRRIPVLLPSLKEQETLAHALGALDDKIELNRRMNQTLEAMARAIFKSWFVDFELAREGNPFHIDHPAELPREWSREKLSSVASINEQTMPREYAHENITYVDISSVSKGCLNEAKSYRTSEAPSRARHLVASGDTIWSCVRPNRRSYLYVHEPPENMVVSTGFAVLTPKRVPPSYLYSWVTSDSFVEYLESSADGSAYPAVRPSRFRDAEILVPSDDILSRFQGIVGPIREKVAINDSESRSLASIRDTLLPKLLSGEIRVKQAEQIVEEVV